MNSYTYDLADRLTSWNNSVATVGYSYDKAGNRTGVGSGVAVYDERDRLVSTSAAGSGSSGSSGAGSGVVGTGSGAGSATYRYTSRGTLSAAVTAAGTLGTRADAFGQVTSQDSAPGQTVSYSYDGLGRVLLPGGSYTGLGNTLAADPTGVYTRDPAGQLLGAASGAAGGGGSTLVWADQHSDVVAQFTTTGTMLAGSAVYDPWGAPLARAGLVGSLGYQSGWTDPGTGRVNMGSRWYNPTTGQFDTRDAASNSPTPDTAAANRYAYASANPLTNVDPAGTWSLRGLARSVGNTIARVATAVVNTVIQVVSAVVNAVVNAVSAVWNAAVGLVRSAVSWAQNTGAGRWVSQQAAAARTWAAQKAEQARAAAKAMVAQARQKAQVEVAKAKRAYAETRQKLADAYQASATWVADHKSLLIEIAAIGVGIGAGLLCGAITLGVGAAACMIGASALINLTKDAAQGNIHNWGDGFASFGTGALQGLGGAAGGLVGGKLAALTAGKLGGIASRLGSRMLLGAIEGGAGDITGQLLTTGKVDWTAVAMSTALGAATGAKSGAAKPGGKPDADVDTPGPQKSSGGDDTPDTPSPSKSSGGDEAPSGGCTSCPCPTHSFTPDTQVVLADGSTRALKDLRVGDLVTTTDPQTGTTRPEPITALHQNNDTDLTDVTLTTTTTTDPRNTANGDHNAQNTTTSVLHTTQHHPLWDETTSTWVHATNLTPGHKLHTTGTGAGAGTTVTVTAVTNHPGNQDMRDLTINEVHTYYVIASDTPILVHNCGGDILADNDLMVRAMNGHQGAMGAIGNARSVAITPNQFREFTSVPRGGAARRQFLADNNISVITGSDAAGIASSPAFRAAFDAVVGAQGRGDAALIGFAAATGRTAVTMEKRLTNFVVHTARIPGVNIRRVMP